MPDLEKLRKRATAAKNVALAAEDDFGYDLANGCLELIDEVEKLRAELEEATALAGYPK